MVNMDDLQKTLHALINGQSAFRQDVLAKIDKLGQKFDNKFDGLDKKIDGVEERLTNRLDKIGRQLAYLENDAPTREEFNPLEKKIANLRLL